MSDKTKNIVDVKNFYTKILIDTLEPLIYEGLKGQYKSATEYNNKINGSPSDIIQIFKRILKEIPNLSKHSIEKETNRIREQSKYSSYFDNLVKAVIKSNLKVLTVRKLEWNNKIEASALIHDCYIECAKVFYNIPTLFSPDFSSLELKKNQMESIKLIKDAINNAILKTLPIQLILSDYLKNTETSEICEKEIKSDKNMIENLIKESTEKKK